MQHHPLPTRRDVLVTGLALLAGLGAAPGKATLDLYVVEKAGLRRFGYPVFAVFPELAGARKLRLLHDGKPVPAQFRPVTDEAGKPAVALDFNVSLAPGESRRYAIEYGDTAAPGPEPNGGLTVERAGGAFRIANGTAFRWDVADDLGGFLKGAGNDRLAYLQMSERGLSLRDKDGQLHRVGGRGPGDPPRATIARQGPYAVALRFESTEPLGAGRTVRSVVVMTFPSSKTWVETTWTIEDPQGLVPGLDLDLPLNIEGKPALVDFGAASVVYGQIRGDERMTLSGGLVPGLADREPLWIVRQGKPDALAPFARARDRDTSRGEGWAHVMDARRATAVAIADFGRSSRDRIEADASGRLRLGRDFALDGASPARGPKSWTFWLHFVPMPVQVGAATSPQSMKSPLSIVRPGSPS